MQETNQHIDALIAARLAGETTPAQEQELEAWLNASVDNRNYYKQLETVWYAGNIPVSDTEAAWKKLEAKLETKHEAKTIPLYLKTILYATAAAIVLAVATPLILNTLKTPMQQMASLDKTASVYLDDSSYVELNKNSELNYPKQFKGDKREVNFTGEAYFDITPNKEKPFVIHTPMVDVRVLGTSFFVKTSTTTVEVWVKTGKVQVSDKQNNTVILEKGQSAVYSSETHTFNEQAEVSTIGFFKYNAIAFNKTTLKQAVETLNKQFDANIVIKNAEIENCKITAEFTNKNLENILFVMETTLGLSVTKTENNTIEIAGNGCE